MSDLREFVNMPVEDKRARLYAASRRPERISETDPKYLKMSHEDLAALTNDAICSLGLLVRVLADTFDGAPAALLSQRDPASLWQAIGTLDRAHRERNLAELSS